MSLRMEQISLMPVHDWLNKPMTVGKSSFRIVDDGEGGVGISLEVACPSDCPANSSHECWH